MLSSSKALAGAALALACGLAGAADLAPPSAALCKPAQKVLFHCSFGAKAVSLCADMAGERIATLGYRFGTPERIELAQDAASDAVPHFNATFATLAPGASVRQVWFERRGYTYLISQCVGGSCPHDAGLAVLRGDKLLANRHCLRSADDRAWFAPELARFGREAAASQAMTPLLVFDDVDNGVERLYPLR
ncbi:MAG: hypothetical protein IPG91_20560 [Ideonella sp.]|nr:hypothetical protein [Ideonella sp.]